MIRVLLVDDQHLVREGFARLLRDVADVEVVGEAADGAEAVELARATRPDVVGPAVVLQLERLQDRMEPFGRELAVAQIERAFGAKLDTLFVSFGEPVAAASIAQVHKARVRDEAGERDVAVKVQYPGADEAMMSDLRQLSRLARSLGPMLPGIDVKALIAELQERTVEELSEVVREQADRVAALERRVAALSARIGVVEEGAVAPPAADQRPPHW